MNKKYLLTYSTKNNSTPTYIWFEKFKELDCFISNSGVEVIDVFKIDCITKMTMIFKKEEVLTVLNNL